VGCLEAIYSSATQNKTFWRHRHYVRLIERTEVLGVLVAKTMKISIYGITATNLGYWRGCWMVGLFSPPKTIVVSVEGGESLVTAREKLFGLLQKKL
jgi:hypothetical protein